MDGLTQTWLEAEQVALLNTAPAWDLVDLVRKTPIGMDRKAALSHLKQNRLNEYYIVLASLYDVAAYLIDGTGVTAGCAADEIGKYFVSVLQGDFPDAPPIPEQVSFATAMRVACEIYGLEQLASDEYCAGRALPRVCGRESVTFEKLLPQVIRDVRQFESFSVSELYMKGGEEHGEFGEALLVEMGKLPHKKIKEPAMSEGADVLITMLSILAKHYPDKTPEQLLSELAKWTVLKFEKYQKRLHA